MGSFAQPGIDLPPRQVSALVERGEAELIDVREPHERAAGRIPDSRHLELERLADAAGTLPRGRTLVFQCRVGARSALAARAFRRHGFDAYNLDGGIVAWVEAGLPLEPEDGHVAPH